MSWHRRRSHRRAHAANSNNQVTNEIRNADDARQVDASDENHRGVSPPTVNREGRGVSPGPSGALAPGGCRAHREKQRAGRAQSTAASRRMQAGDDGAVTSAEDEETATAAGPEPRRNCVLAQASVTFPKESPAARSSHSLA